MRLETDVSLHGILDITNPIIYGMMQSEKKAYLPMNFLKLEMTDDDALISYLDPKKGVDVDYQQRYTSDKRQTAKAGKVLRAIFPPELPDEKIATIVARIKLMSSKNYELSLVEGDDIQKWYSFQRAECSVFTKAGTSLYGSCFQGTRSAKEFEIFKAHPDRIKMLLVTHEGLLDGRGLVWIDTKSGVPHIDRIYTSSPQALVLINKHITDNKWKQALHNGCAVDIKPGFRAGQNCFPYFDYMRISGNQVISS